MSGLYLLDMGCCCCLKREKEHKAVCGRKWEYLGVLKVWDKPNQNLVYENKWINKWITQECSTLWTHFTPLWFFPGKPVMIVTEYMENGSLDTFLKVRFGFPLAIYCHIGIYCYCACGLRLKLSNLNGKVLNGFKKN